MAVEVLTITRLPDGTYQVTEQEPNSELPGADTAPPIAEKGKSAEEVLQLVQSFLSNEAQEVSPPRAPEQAKQAWQQEASTRDPVSGLRM